MVNYENTKIYYIPVGDERYYGHTANELRIRKSQHKCHFKNQSDIKLYKIMRELGMTADDIELIWVEDYPCETKYQAHARERYWIENYGTLNVVIPNRTTKEWYVKNKDKHLQYVREYKANNKDKMREYQAIYRAEWYVKNKDGKIHEYNAKNKDKMREYQAIYRAQHKDKMREYQANYRAENKKKMADSQKN